MKSSVAALLCVITGGLLLTTARAQTSAAGWTAGSSAEAASATRSVTLAPGMRWVNVSQGETVRFVAGTSSFTWRFDGVGARSFDLRSVAPSGALDQALTVYVAPAPGRRSN